MQLFNAKMGRGNSFDIKVPWTTASAAAVMLVLAAFLPMARPDVTPLSAPFHSKLVSSSCPQLLPEVFDGFVPAGEYNKDRTHYVPATNDTKTVESCVTVCCEDPDCQVAFMVQTPSNFSCYKVNCPRSDLHCVPKEKAAEGNGWAYSVALVRPNSTDKNWHQLLTADRSCDYGMDECRAHEECHIPPRSKSKVGVCKCQEGWVPDTYGMCKAGPHHEKQQLTVSVLSKNITLPENSASLTAYAIPNEAAEGEYTYEWSLVGNTATADGTMEDTKKQQLKLSNLKAGLYTFKVVVQGKDAYGEATGYVGVTASARVNSPPEAVVKPPRQRIPLPTNTAIVDGSESKDDADKDLKFQWSLEVSPISYKEKLEQSAEKATLTLKNLIAGNYTVKMTVTDSEGATNSTEAYLEVIEETDYPPTANAGEDKIVYLPQKTVKLYGNGSSDDHGIVSYEWSRTASNDQKTQLSVDIANSNKPILHLSNFEVGTYEFTLTVTDGKGQQASDSVKVYIKPPSNLPPEAVATVSTPEISLPTNWALLDGTKSRDDINITAYKWVQVGAGSPNTAVIINDSAAVANATGLTKGSYTFNLTVTDGAGNTDTASVSVAVKQDTNAAPVAAAGADMTVVLPLTEVVVNGSGSTDDLRVAKWLWTRQPASLAAGIVVGGSDKTPLLRLTGLVPGQYLFSLKVWDDQGKSSEDSVSINVHEDPNHLDVVEAVLNEQVTALTTARLDLFTQKIKLLLSDETDAGTGGTDSPYHVKILQVSSRPHSDNVVIKFIVEKDAEDSNKKLKTSVMKGPSIVEELNKKLKVGQDILKLQVIELDTVVCQNDCSGHGKCQQSTRECICEPFWIENPVRRALMDGNKNCDWSVVYVIIASAVVTCAILALVIYQRCWKARRRRSAPSSGSKSRSFRSSNGRPKRRYTRLEQSEPGMELRNAHTSSLMMSESDSDSEGPLFTDELTSNAKKRAPRMRNGHGPNFGDGSSSDNNVATVRRPNGSAVKSRRESDGIA